MPRPPAKCGTNGGYYRHIKTLKEEPCDDCKAAHAEAQRGPGSSPWSPAECGTDAGYYRHHKTLKEQACPDCCAAHAAADRRRRAGQRATPPRRCPCGTVLRTVLRHCSRCRKKRPHLNPRDITTSPDGWVRKGLILVPVYEQEAEVA